MGFALVVTRRNPGLDAICTRLWREERSSAPFSFSLLLLCFLFSIFDLRYRTISIDELLTADAIDVARGLRLPSLLVNEPISAIFKTIYDSYVVFDLKEAPPESEVPNIRNSQQAVSYIFSSGVSESLFSRTSTSSPLCTTPIDKNMYILITGNVCTVITKLCPYMDPNVRKSTTVDIY